MIKTKQWADGSSATIQYGGQGDGQIIITSDPNEHYEARSMQITVETTDGSGIQRVVTVNQAAKQRIDLSAAVVTASNQTYSGSAKTPTPTVTLNGNTVPSSGYDVTYSNNTNAGTANITVTGKGDYTGTAYGTFTINKADPVYVAPTANNRTYSTSSDALLVAGSNTTPGSFTYSSSQSGTYSSTIPSQTNAGTYTTWWKFTPTDTSNYNSVGATSISTTISPKTVSSPTITLSTSTYTYNGSAKTPTPTVKDGSVTIPSSEYTVSYSNNTNAGTAYCIITDNSGGNYTISGSKAFTINKASRTLSFTDSYVVLNTSSNITKTATVNKGSGDGAITYSISSTTYATINSSTGKVTSKTSDGSATVTATIAEGTNYLSASASYTLYVFATTHNYSYSGSAKNVTLPPGTYQFQCWGAQGGSNGTNSTYGITAQAGGKGGYSVGQLSIAQALAIQVLVGGQGSASAAGYNGGGSTTGTSQYSSGDTFGYSKMGGGGGASDIRLSDGALLSRMIVAGGGSGGAMCYKKTVTTETVTTYDSLATGNMQNYTAVGTYWNADFGGTTIPYIQIRLLTNNLHYTYINFGDSTLPFNLSNGDKVRVRLDSAVSILKVGYEDGMPPNTALVENSNSVEWTISNGSMKIYIYNNSVYSGNVYVEKVVTTTVEHVTTDTSQQTGYAGGGTTGAGYSSTYEGKQNAAGSGGSFGQGANQTTTNYRYCSGAGGGGWYGGGGGQKSDSSMTYVHYSGGGSGFVNTAASAGNRPSGYTGLELESGETYAGNTSFPAPGGGNETGHSGNGYIRITRIN